MYKVYSKLYFPFTSIVEVWKDVPDWEECYEVSSFGRVRSRDKIRLKLRMGKSVSAVYKGQMRKQEVTNMGYNRVNFRDCERDFNLFVHRLVAHAFIANLQDKPTVNHIDGNKLNNNVSNLEWNTSSEQVQHAIANKLMTTGHKRTISPTVRKEIYNCYINERLSINELSRRFNINRDMASEIAAGKTEPSWKIPHSDLMEMVELGRQGWHPKDLAKKFNCSKSQAYRIIKGQSRSLCMEGINE